VRLTADNPVDNSLDIFWAGLSPIPATLEFYLDTDTAGCDGPLIHSQDSPPASGSFSWQRPGDGVASPANVAPGDYYVCARADGSIAGYSAGQLTVSHSPIIHFTHPSFTSGDDYATDAGNSWDMNDRTDVDHVVQGSYSVSEGVLAVTVPASASDTQVYLNVPTSIDSARYYYLSYRVWFDYPYRTSDVGQNNRIFWGRLPDTEATSELLYVYPGWMTYTLDLRSFPPLSGPTWETADWTLFRIDPIGQNKTGETVTVYVDGVKLTGDKEADGYAHITWRMTDPDTAVTTMTLHYDTDQTGLDGMQIATLSLKNGEQTGSAMPVSAHVQPPLSAATTLSETVYLPMVVRDYVPPCTGACYTWYTNSIAPGTYYLYACVDDGFNLFCRYSEAPLYISH
jgi:hypothetical protein